MSGSTYAEQAAQLIGPQIGVDPSIIYGQFIAENGASLSPSGAYNYGNLQINGQEQSYSSVGSFVSAFVQTIKDHFSAAENTGSNAQAYVSGLLPSTGLQYETGVSAQTYLANIESGANQMSGSSQASSSNSGTSFLDSWLMGASGGLVDTQGNQTATDQAAAVGKAVTNPVGTLSSFLGLNIGVYDLGFIILGAILVIGAIFFISKPAVQSVTVNAAKLAATVGA